MNSDRSIPLILLLARVSLSDEEKSRAGVIILDEMQHWDKFIDLATLHGLAPLLFRHLCLFGSVPERVTESFKRAYLSNLHATVRSSLQLRDVVGTLERADVPCIPLKGLAVAEELYGDPACYPSTDIDVLVMSKDIQKATHVMKDVGYHLKVREDDPFYRANYPEMHFFKRGSKTVELHHRLGKNRYFNIPEQFWWEDLRERTLEGYGYKVLSPEKTLLFLSIHLFGHGYAPFKFVVTIAELLRTYEDRIDWEVLRRDAGKFHADKPLMLSVYLAVTMLNAPVPQEILQVFGSLPLKERTIYQKIRKDIFKERARYSVVMFLLTVLQYNALEVLRRLIKWLFPPLKELSYRYNLPRGSKRVYVYYVLNPFLLLLKKREL